MPNHSASLAEDDVLDPNDPIARHLESLGHTLEPYYFLDSDWQVGYQVQLGTVRIAFRTEGDTVIICDLVSTSDSANGLGSGVMRFLRFVREIIKLPGIQRVKGMMLDGIGSDEEQAKRAELAELYLSHGARPVFEEGYRWLVFENQHGQAKAPR